jgi:hypothetical protein
MTMWQKARIVRHRCLSEIIGREVWVKDLPTLCSGIDHYTGEETHTIGYEVAILPTPPRSASSMRKEDLELIPEFAEDVPLISWEDFLKGDAMAKGGFQR